MNIKEDPLSQEKVVTKKSAWSNFSKIGSETLRSQSCSFKKNLRRTISQWWNSKSRKKAYLRYRNSVCKRTRGRWCGSWKTLRESSRSRNHHNLLLSLNLISLMSRSSTKKSRRLFRKTILKILLSTCNLSNPTDKSSYLPPTTISTWIAMVYTASHHLTIVSLSSTHI